MNELALFAGAGGGFSVEKYLDGIRSERLKLRSTRESVCWPGSEMECSMHSRFGTMCAPLTASRGEDASMLSAGDSPVKIFHRQEKEQGLREPEAGFGKRCAESFARYDRDTHSWRTHQCSLLGGLEPYSVTWPKRGTMRNGWCWEPPMWGHRTEGTEYGFLPEIDDARLIPTPTCRGLDGGAHSRAKLRKLDVWLGTPTASMSCRSKKFLEGAERLPTPAEFAAKWGNTPRNLIPTPKVAEEPEEVARLGWKPGDMYPTPMSHNAKELTLSPSNARRKTPGLGTLAAAGALGTAGRLNPMWVEWLMGWPLGWTDLKPLEMGKYHLWQQQHFMNS